MWIPYFYNYLYSLCKSTFVTGFWHLIYFLKSFFFFWMEFWIVSVYQDFWGNFCWCLFSFPIGKCKIIREFTLKKVIVERYVNIIVINLHYRIPIFYIKIIEELVFTKSAPVIYFSTLLVAIITVEDDQIY